MTDRGRVLVLWNDVEEDIYERWREEGPRTLAWDPTRTVPDVGTVAEENAALFAALDRAGFEVHKVNIEDDLERLMGALRLYRPDAVMNLVEFFNDDPVQEPYVAGIYEMMGFSYTGNRPLTLATCQNKHRTKAILVAAGLPTAPYFLVKKEPIPDDHGLEFPLIVKPVADDASAGISHNSVVHNQDELVTQVRRVHKEFEMPALVERYIEGREIHAAVLGNEHPEVLPLFEMEFDDSEFNPTGEWRPQIISYRAKWDPHSKDFYSMDAVCPAPDIDPEMEEYIREVTIGAYKALGCRDYARVDMRYDEDEGEVYILEVNPNPDLVDGAAYMMCASASGRTYAQTLGEIVDMAVKRGRDERARAEAAACQPALPTDALLREAVAAKVAAPESAAATSWLGDTASPPVDAATDTGDLAEAPGTLGIPEEGAEAEATDGEAAEQDVADDDPIDEEGESYDEVWDEDDELAEDEPDEDEHDEDESGPEAGSDESEGHV